MKTQRGLDWYQNVTGGQSTHYVTDGVEGYYTSAPGVTRREVAKAFAATYDHNNKPGYVVAEMAVCRPGDDGGTQHSDGVAFAFDPDGHFEWGTSRAGDAVGYLRR